MLVHSRSSPKFFATVLLTIATACSRQTEPAASAASTAAPAQKMELSIYAATSTRDVLQSLETEYEASHNVDLVFNFGSSGDLSKQIVAAGKADVFLSADEKEMDKLDQAGLLAADTRRALLSNQLVVIEPMDGASSFVEPFAPKQIADARIKRLSLANVETVPAGRYAKAWLEKTGVWSGVADRVLPGVDVRAALGAVESGGAQAGIVYRTDAARSKKARVVFGVPLDQGPKISYPLAVLGSRPAERTARDYADFLVSEKAKAAFESFGFIALSAPK